MANLFQVKNAGDFTEIPLISNKTMKFQLQGFKSSGCASKCLVLVTLLLLQACASKPSLTAPEAEASAAKEVLPAADFFVPSGSFGKVPNLERPTAATALPKPLTSAGAVAPPAFAPQVWLYASPSTQAYLTSAGLDATMGVRLWEVFLRKYKIPFKKVSSAEQLENSQPGVLLLPSSVALSDAEQRAVVNFRAKGGSVLATWLTGVRGAKGQWLGFDFMSTALGVQVLGDTQDDEEDNFMSTYGDNPVTHALPAGQRIWLERVQGWYPLRLAGGHAAAEVTDWSRNFILGKQATTLVFDERALPSGAYSRSVVLGYPERLWLSADPQQLEAIAHNALMWLLRQPDAYLAAWPEPFGSALVMAIDTAEVMLPSDLQLAQQLENAGGHGTYFVLGDAAQKSADVLKKLQARGHEIAYMGDSFAGFRDQSTKVQSKRLETMRQLIQSTGLELAADAGFHAPMESYDKTTEKLLREGAFGYYVAFMDATDTRLPVLLQAEPSQGTETIQKQTLVLPRTQSGPDDVMEENDPEDGMKIFMGALDVSQHMAGLSVLRLPNQSLLTPEQLGEVFGYLKTRKDQTWMVTAAKVNQWWRARERVKVNFQATQGVPVLTVTIAGVEPVAGVLAVRVNLPQAYSTLRLKAIDAAAVTPKVRAVDAWRASVLLDGLKPGRYQWELAFDPVTR